jgi:hypothetical protein
VAFIVGRKVDRVDMTITKMPGKILIPIVLVTVLLGAVRVVLGPIYRMHDGCTCGRERTWVCLGDFSSLRNKKFSQQVVVMGDEDHKHQYWDSTWISQFWFWEDSRPLLKQVSL